MSAPEAFQSALDRAFAGMRRAREGFTPTLAPQEVGTITTISTGIARVSGLPGVGFEELVTFPGGVFGIAFNLDEREIGVVLLGEYWNLHTGDEVLRTGRVMDVAPSAGALRDGHCGPASTQMVNWPLAEPPMEWNTRTKYVLPGVRVVNVTCSSPPAAVLFTQAMFVKVVQSFVVEEYTSNAGLYEVMP